MFKPSEVKEANPSDPYNGDYQTVLNPPASSGPLAECICARIVTINDVYEFDHLPSVRTILLEAKKQCKNTISTLPGDFLSPSLMSAIDKGSGMIDVMNRIPIDLVCLGNHEGDELIGDKALYQRVREFKGQWVNTNMPTFTVPTKSDRKEKEAGDGFVSHYVWEVDGMRIGFVGVLTNKPSLYRKAAFNGQIPKALHPNECAVEWHKRMTSDDFPGGKCDYVIPLTHQRMPGDRALLETGLFPAVIGGHDHDLYCERLRPTDDSKSGDKSSDEFSEMSGNKSSGNVVLKVGHDGEQVGVVDMYFHPKTRQLVHVGVQILQSRAFEAEKSLVERVQEHRSVLKDLQAVELLSDLKRPLDTRSVRTVPSSGAIFFASIIREMTGCDCALITGGAVRGNKLYDSAFSLGDVYAELPFPNLVVQVEIPGAVIQQIVGWTREQTKGGTVQVSCFLHGDCDMAFEDQKRPTHPTHIGGQLIDPKRIYRVGLFKVICRGLDKIQPLLKYFEDNPDRVPGPDEGIHLRPLVASFFCRRIWSTLGDFKSIDTDGSKSISLEELKAAVIDKHPTLHPMVVEKMIHVIDDNDDGMVTLSEFSSFDNDADGIADSCVSVERMYLA